MTWRTVVVKEFLPYKSKQVSFNHKEWTNHASGERANGKTRPLSAWHQPHLRQLPWRLPRSRFSLALVSPLHPQCTRLVSLSTRYDEYSWTRCYSPNAIMSMNVIRDLLPCILLHWKWEVQAFSNVFVNMCRHFLVCSALETLNCKKQNTSTVNPHQGCTFPCLFEMLLVHYDALVLFLWQVSCRLQVLKALRCKASSNLK